MLFITPRKDSEMNETNTRPIAMQIGLPAGHLVTQPPVTRPNLAHRSGALSP